MRNSLLSISLVSILILPFLGTYGWLSYQKYLIKEEVKERLISGIEPSELVQLTFTIEESQSLLNWEHEREFEYNDQMYDIVDVDTVGNEIVYSCWWDHAETAINIELKKLLTVALESNQKHKQQQQTLVKTIQFEYVKTELFFDLNTSICNVVPAFFYSFSFTSISLNLDNPPPQIS